MLIDLHAHPGDLDPDTFARACADAGLDAVVVCDTLRTDRLDEYLDALDEVGVTGFVGVHVRLDRGAVVAIPTDDDDAFRARRWAPPWTADELGKRLEGFDGVVVAGHPYQREEGGGPILGDRVYFMKLSQLAGIETRVGRGEQRWDAMADRAAEKRNLARIGSSSGDAKHIGAAMTVVLGDIESQADLVEALRAGRTMPVEFEDPANPRPRPRRDDRPGRDDRRDDRREGRGRRDDRGGRGGRGRRDEGGRGGRRGGRGRDQ